MFSFFKNVRVQPGEGDSRVCKSLWSPRSLLWVFSSPLHVCCACIKGTRESDWPVVAGQSVGASLILIICIKLICAKEAIHDLNVPFV